VARVSLGSPTPPPASNWDAPSIPNAEARELGIVWAKLCQGEWRIIRHVQEELRTTLHVGARRGDGYSRWAIRGRSLVILQRVLSGQSLNFISLDLALSKSTVSAEFQFAMRALELEPRLSGLPMYLPQLWHASRARPFADSALRDRFQGDQGTIVSLPRPELRLTSVLTRAELEVCSILLQGQTHAEIAARRGTSTRTIANQLASIFTKLNVSGRLELLTTLARGRIRASSGASRNTAKQLCA